MPPRLLVAGQAERRAAHCSKRKAYCPGRKAWSQLLCLMPPETGSCSGAHDPARETLYVDFNALVVRGGGRATAWGRLVRNEDGDWFEPPLPIAFGHLRQLHPIRAIGTAGCG